jgi:hypothetical protein
MSASNTKFQPTLVFFLIIHKISRKLKEDLIMISLEEKSQLSNDFIWYPMLGPCSHGANNAFATREHIQTELTSCMDHHTKWEAIATCMAQVRWR